ncbi:MAG: DUF1905 domain-containing protein [Mesorhizobium sp.]|nr:MAG: DUF1905 domain-containing protein [Mesorhizobium sp.]
MFRYDVQAEIWVYPGKGGWHFVTLPPELGARIKTATAGMAGPWGWRHGQPDDRDAVMTTLVLADGDRLCGG